MRDISLKELLEAGCHFGHQVTRQNPRAREFIFQAREGVHIIDLAKTKEGLEQAGAFVKTTASQGGTIVFVGTKRQAKKMLEEAAKRAGAYVVSERWIGGTLTNRDEVLKNYKKLKDLRARLQSDEEKAKFTKKEVGLWDKKRIKLEKLYAGIADLEALPDVLFIVDTHKEHLAVKEANRMSVPVVGIVDTNADPTVVDYPIAANDDAVGSLELIINYIADAWMEGQKEKDKIQTEEKIEVMKETKEPEGTQVLKKEKTTKSKTKATKEKEGESGKRKPRSTKKTA